MLEYDGKRKRFLVVFEGGYMKVQFAGQMALLVLLAGCAPTTTTETGKQEEEKALTPAEELLDRSIAYHCLP